MRPSLNTHQPIGWDELRMNNYKDIGTLFFFRGGGGGGGGGREYGHQ